MLTTKDRIHLPWEEPPAEGEVRQVADQLYWVRLPLPMKLDHVNVYILEDQDGLTLIDTGMGSKRTKAIWRSLLERHFPQKPVRQVIITHHHPDHIGLAGWFMRDYGATLVSTRTSYLMGRMLTLDVQDLPPPETVAFWRSAGMPEDIIAERVGGKPFNFADTVAPVPLGYKRIQQGDTLDMGGRTWTVHVGHGHAPEHATFWSADDSLMIAGDQVISSISPNLGVYVTEPEADPVGEWIEVCERLEKLAKPSHLVLSGHKMPFYGLPFRLNQLIENHHSALERLADYLDTPKSAHECFQPLFKRKIGEGEYGLALVEAVAHLNHLHQAGRVTRSLGDNGTYYYHRLAVD